MGLMTDQQTAASLFDEVQRLRAQLAEAEKETEDAKEDMREAQAISDQLQEDIKDLRIQVKQADERGDEALRRAHAAEAEVERLQAELKKGRERDAMFCNTIERGYLAMQAAWLEAELTGAANGMVWIHNTLCGPGLLPDLDEARALGGAQAWFDRESAKLDQADAAREAKATGASHV